MSAVTFDFSVWDLLLLLVMTAWPAVLAASFSFGIGLVTAGLLARFELLRRTLIPNIVGISVGLALFYSLAYIIGF
ncbi:MAG: hypothetical protein DI498_10090 [Paracoccus denitrificans]|nr:MAG: hypothetical protein DI498_10090 [Paracoccus denitrificans]PZO83912.1 MAG: hypothetical protein DI633_10090 [Paracoccus denitrificans]